MTSNLLPKGSPFRSFFMGGFECSTHRLRSGRRLDLLDSTRHDRFALQDYRRMAAAGMRSARDGIRWHLIERTPGRYDFSSVLPMLEASQEAGIEILWDLLHYGWPDGLEIFSDEFVERFAGFSAAFTRLASEALGTDPFLVPVNEMSFFAWAGGDAAVFNPACTGRGMDLKIQLARASIASVRAILDTNPNAKILHTDPMINICAHVDRPEEHEAAEAYRLAQFEALDMIAGRLHPELGGSEEYLGIIGVNYYVHNQWIYPGGHGMMIAPSHPRYRPIWEMLREVHERYQRPMFIAETGIEDEARPAWLRYVGHEVRRALREQLPVYGLCLYPVVNHPGWEDDRHCRNGLWDYADPHGHRDAYAPLEQELIVQQRLLREQLQRGEMPEEPEEVDTSELDVAAHWMDIRSSREELLHT